MTGNAVKIKTMEMKLVKDKKMIVKVVNEKSSPKKNDKKCFAGKMY